MVQTRTVTSANAYMPMGVDNAWDFEEFKENFSVKVCTQLQYRRIPACMTVCVQDASRVHHSHASLQVMKLDRDEGTMQFDLIGVDPAVANTLRRILIAEIPTVAVEHVFVVSAHDTSQQCLVAGQAQLCGCIVQQAQVEYLELGLSVTYLCTQVNNTSIIQVIIYRPRPILSA